MYTENFHTNHLVKELSGQNKLKPGIHWRQSKIRHGGLCGKSHVALAPYTLVTKPKGRSTFGWQKLPTFGKVDRVEYVQLWWQCWPRQNWQSWESQTSRQQSTFDKPTTNSKVSVTDGRQSRQSTLSPVYSEWAW